MCSKPRQRLERPVATDGGEDVDYDAIREDVPFFVRRSNARGAKAALHLPAEDATREDLAVRCKYNQRDGVSWRVQELEATPDWQLDKRGCSDCFGRSSKPTESECGRKPADVLKEAGFEIATDGGSEELERRETITETDDGIAIGEDAVPTHGSVSRTGPDEVHGGDQ